MAKNQTSEEEVDLASLFYPIGKAGEKAFNFFRDIFLGIFYFVILILLFTEEYFIKLAIASMVGGGIRAYFQYIKDKTFGSDLLLQPDFESTKQLI